MSLASYRRRFSQRPLPRPRSPALVSTEIRPVAWPSQWIMYLRGAWARLHRRALMARGDDDSTWLTEFGRSLPCGACRAHWDAMLLRSPPDWGAYFRWSWERHAEVNAALGKPNLSYEAAETFYRGSHG